MLKDYNPINYDKWIIGNEAREGVNIKRLRILNELELKIFDASFSYQDCRDDPGHGEMSAYFALEFLKYFPGRREIAVPTAILHDIGWFGNDPQAWKNAVKENKNDLQSLETEMKRRPHQNRGIFLATQILNSVGYFEKYPLKNGLEIADIIGDHDTRKLPANEEGKNVRFADFLWRPTFPCLQIFFPKESEDELVNIVERTCLYEPKSPLEGVAFEIAKIELANTIFFRFGEKKAEKVLKKDYFPEFKKVKEFYFQL